MCLALPSERHVAEHGAFSGAAMLGVASIVFWLRAYDAAICELSWCLQALWSHEVAWIFAKQLGFGRQVGSRMISEPAGKDGCRLGEFQCVWLNYSLPSNWLQNAELVHCLIGDSTMVPLRRHA